MSSAYTAPRLSADVLRIFPSQTSGPAIASQEASPRRGNRCQSCAVSSNTDEN